MRLSALIMGGLVVIAGCGGGGGSKGGGIIFNPDLVLRSLTLGKTTLAPNESTAVTFEVVNQGSDDANNSFNVGLYSSSDSNISTADTLSGSAVISFLNEGQSQQVTTIVQATSTPGTFFVGAFVDDLQQVTETNESNNISNTLTVTVVGNAFDLTATSFTLAPTTLTTGQTANGTFTINNVGGTATGAFRVGFYQSTDTTLTTTDTLIGSLNYTSLGASQSLSAQPVQLAITSSSQRGTFFFGVVADDQNNLGESNENNNSSNTVQVTIN